MLRIRVNRRIVETIEQKLHNYLTTSQRAVFQAILTDSKGIPVICIGEDSVWEEGYEYRAKNCTPFSPALRADFERIKADWLDRLYEISADNLYTVLQTIEYQSDQKIYDSISDNDWNTLRLISKRNYGNRICIWRCEDKGDSSRDKLNLFSPGGHLSFTVRVPQKFFDSLEKVTNFPIMSISGYENITNQEERKENKTMNIKPNMNFDFGPCGDGIAMSPYGLAIKVKDTWLTYNAATNQTVDVNGIIFSMKGMIYKIPVSINAVQVGDMIIHQGKAMYVTSVNGKNIEAVDIMASEAKNIIPVTNMFGFNFVTKVTSLVGTNIMGQPSTDQPFGNIMPMLFMSQMFGDNENGDGIFGEDFMKMLLFSQMMSGSNNMFGNMFNFNNNIATPPQQ